MEREDTGAMCNKAIMVITDGAPENHEEVFEKYNWPEKNVSRTTTFSYTACTVNSVKIALVQFLRFLLFDLRSEIETSQ